MDCFSIIPDDKVARATVHITTQEFVYFIFHSKLYQSVIECSKQLVKVTFSNIKLGTRIVVFSKCFVPQHPLEKKSRNLFPMFCQNYASMILYLNFIYTRTYLLLF